MARPVTLFTGQWADLPLADLAAKCSALGFDGLELACWGDHFEVDKALADGGYVRSLRALLERHELGVWAIGGWYQIFLQDPDGTIVEVHQTDYQKPAA